MATIDDRNVITNKIHDRIAATELALTLEPFDILCEDEFEDGYAYLIIETYDQGDDDFVVACLQDLFPEMHIESDRVYGIDSYVYTQVNFVFDMERYTK